MRYDFRVAGPDERIAVGICASSAAKERVLSAVLAGERRPFTDRDAAPRFPEDPAITLKVMAPSIGRRSAVAEGIGLRNRPAPPARATTIVADSDTALD